MRHATLSFYVLAVYLSFVIKATAGGMNSIKNKQEGSFRICSRARVIVHQDTKYTLLLAGRLGLDSMDGRWPYKRNYDAAIEQLVAWCWL